MTVVHEFTVQKKSINIHLPNGTSKMIDMPTRGEVNVLLEKIQGVSPVDAINVIEEWFKTKGLTDEELQHFGFDDMLRLWNLMSGVEAKKN